MKIEDVYKGGMFIAIAAAVLLIMLFLGLDVLDVFFVLWIVIGLAATGLGYIIAFAIDIFTDKDPRAWVMPVFPLLCAAITGIWIIIEGKSFMGRIGQSVIFMLFTVPLIITAIVWTVISIVSAGRKIKRLEKEVTDMKISQ